MKSPQPITHERLLELLSYDPVTGIFAHRVMRSGVRPGRSPGTARAHGHIVITLDGRNYFATRLAWLYVKGGWPSSRIYLRDSDPKNLRFDNLCEAAQNTIKQMEDAPYKNSATGVRGVTWRAKDKKFVAQIMADGVLHRLGRFDSLEQASAAYATAKAKFHASKGLQNQTSRKKRSAQ